MAFKRSWAHVKRAAEPTTFMGKYGLKRVAGLDGVGKECFAIPLDMASGYSVLPYHSLKKNDGEGFHGSRLGSTKISCKRYDPETGERSEELPLCCKLAQMEKDRKPDQEDSSQRALNFTSWRYVFPVLVLGTTEDNPKKKPTLKKLSLDGIGFSYIDLAESSYDDELKSKVIEALQENGKIEDPENMDQEELMTQVANYISHSILKVSNVAAKSPAIPYQKAFRLVPVTNNLVGAESGEAGAIRVLCKLLAGEYKPEQFDKIYAKYPILKEINNQVIDFLQLYNDNVDNLVEDWTEEELQKYYNAFIDKQNQIEGYKRVNDEVRANAEDEDVSFSGNADEEDEDFGFATPEPETPKAAKKPAVKPAKAEVDEDLEDIDISDSIEDGEEFLSEAPKATPAKAVKATKPVEEDTEDYSVDDLDEPVSKSSSEEFSESDFDMDEEFEEEFV